MTYNNSSMWNYLSVLKETIAAWPVTEARECLIRAEEEWYNSGQTSTKTVKMFKSGVAESVQFCIAEIKNCIKQFCM